MAYAAASALDNIHPSAEDDVAAILLYVVISLGIIVAMIPYAFEIQRTYRLQTEGPGLPAPVSVPVPSILDASYLRNIVMHAPAITWLVLSFVSIGMLLYHRPEPVDSCSTLNVDIAALGSRVSLWVSGAIVILMASLGHYHAEETGVTNVKWVVFSAQSIYALNLCIQNSTDADKIVGAMVLDCLSLMGSAIFSMKECLASRQTIRIGFMVQLFCFLVIVTIMRGLEHGDSSCLCFQVFWWGLLDSCGGPSPTCWLYFTWRSTSTVHNAWLCYYHMPYYDAAEKSTRCDTNTKFLDIEKTVYDSIPATAFTKHREIIPVFIASVVNVEITVSAFDGLQLRGWGQTASVVGAAFTLASFIYSIYCMFKEKNVKRRQDVINNSSFGADIPQLPIFHSSQVLAWVGYGGTEDYSASPSIWEAGPPLSGSLPVRLPRCGLGCEKEQL